MILNNISIITLNCRLIFFDYGLTSNGIYRFVLGRTRLAQFSTLYLQTSCKKVFDEETIELVAFFHIIARLAR